MGSDAGMDIVSKDVVPMPVIIYGRSSCEDTAWTRDRLNELRVSFVEENIEEDETAARYVEQINHGERITPVVVFGDEDIILVEPDEQELMKALRKAGYSV